MGRVACRKRKQLLEGLQGCPKVRRASGPGEEVPELGRFRYGNNRFERSMKGKERHRRNKFTKKKKTKTIISEKRQAKGKKTAPVFRARKTRSKPLFLASCSLPCQNSARGVMGEDIIMQPRLGFFFSSYFRYLKFFVLFVDPVVTGPLFLNIVKIPRTPMPCDPRHHSGFFASAAANYATANQI